MIRGGAGLGLMMQALLVTGGAAAADLPPTHLTVMGSLGGTAQYRDLEKPFWTHQLEADSDGRVTADITPFDQTGLKGFEALQMARLGVTSFLTVPLSLISSEDPEANAPDLPGLNASIGALMASLAAYRPVLVELYRARYGLETLAMISYPAQVLFCKEPFAHLSDIAGRNVRVASATQAGLVAALGARGIVLPFAAISRALVGGKIDCTITGALTGNAIGLQRLTHYIGTLPINWGIQIVVANHASWMALAPEVRAFLTRELADLERKAADIMARSTEQGLACDTGRRDCIDGTRGNMVPVAADAADRAVLDRILRTVVLPKWAQRCGEGCVAQWNRTVGAVRGLKAEVAP